MALCRLLPIVYLLSALLLLRSDSAGGQTLLSVQVWCNKSASCSGPPSTNFSVPLGVCQLQQDNCNSILTAAVEWNVCESGVLFTVNARLGINQCTGVGTYTFLLLCDTCNSVSIAGVVSYSILPSCPQPSTRTCPPASAVPTSLPLTLPPLPPLPPLPSPTPPPPSSPGPTTVPTPPITPRPSSSPLPALNHGPRALGPAQYASKTGQLVNAGVTLAEVFLQMDQDIYYLDFSECVGQAAATTPPVCAACNYVYGPNCGRSPSGPQCPCDFYLAFLLCGTQLQAEITPVAFSTPTTLALLDDFAFSRLITAYVPPGVSGPIRISVNVHAGSEDIYIAVVDAAEIVKVATNSVLQLRVMWDSNIPTLTICPGTPSYPHSGQTFFIIVTAAMRTFHTFPYVPSKRITLRALCIFSPIISTTFTLLVEELPSVLPYSPPPVLPTALPPPSFQPLVTAEGQLNVSFASQRDRFYTVTFGGPCPRYFAASLHLPYLVVKAVALVVAESPNQLGNSTWRDEALGQARVAYSFCPDDLTAPTTLYIQASSDTTNDIASLFWTSDPTKIRVFPMVPGDRSSSSPYSIAKSVQRGVSLRCGDVTFTAPSRLPRAGPAYLGMLPPARKSSAVWPIVVNAILDGNARVSFMPPEDFLSPNASAPSSPLDSSLDYTPSLLHFAANTIIHQPGSDGALWETMWVPDERLDSCSVVLVPTLTNANGLPCDGAPIPLVKRNSTCSVDTLRTVKATVDRVIAKCYPGNSVEANSVAVAQLDAIEMSDEWQACVWATESFFAKRTQVMSPVQSTTVCSDPSMDTSCCSPGAMIDDGACVPAPGFELATNRTLNADGLLSSLPESECIETYLSDYGNLADAQCLDTTPYALGWFMQQTLPFTTCYVDAFGLHSDEVCARQSLVSL